MFANFAAKRHLTGPLRAVSPVAESDNEIDWKAASLEASALTSDKADVLLSDNTQKLNAYFKKVLAARAVKEPLTVKDSLQLAYVEAISLIIPSIYIAFVLFIFSALIMMFVEPTLRNVSQGHLLMATVWICLALLCFGVLLLFLRPLFGGFRSYHGRTLQYEDAPALMTLVEELSQHLGVKAPKRIEINNETTVRVDAFSGINSIYRDEYKIIIGAPVLMSLSLTQLVGLLAHELAHFQNKQQKIAFYLMHHVSEWLYFRASGQDKRHQLLLRRMQKQKLSLNEFSELWVWQRIHLLQQGVFGFMFSLHRKLTSWKCREIELYTDRLAISVVGSDAFKEMIESIRSVQGAQKKVSEQNHWAWKEGFLLDDYALAVAVEAKSSNSQHQYLRNKEVTRFCPSDEVRLAQAQELNCKGNLPAKASASLLLEQARKISCELTLLDYESSGILNARQVVVSSQKIRQLKERDDKVEGIAKRYFECRLGERVLNFSQSKERDVTSFGVEDCIHYIRRNRVEDSKYLAVYQGQINKIHKGYVISRLLEAKLPVSKYLKEEVTVKGDGAGRLLKLRHQSQRSLQSMEAMDQVFYQRAHEALMKMDEKSRLDAADAFQNLESYGQLRVSLAQLKEAFSPLNLIVHGLTHGVKARALQAGAVEKQSCWDLLGELRVNMQARSIYVGLSRKKVHLVTYLDVKLGQIPVESSDMTIEDMAIYTDEFLKLLNFQYHKWLGQLAVVMTRYEKSNRIEPINLLR